MNKFYAFVLGFLVSTSALAGNSPLPDGPYVVADGSSEIDVAPDFAVINFGLETTDKTTEAASKIVDAKTQKALQVLRDLSIPLQDIHASSVQVQPKYDDRSNDQQVYLGQTVSRDVQVTLHDLTKYSDLMDGLFKANIDTTGEITFGSSREEQYKNQAMDKAIDDAHAHGLEMVSHAGMHLGNPYAMASSKYRAYITQGYPMGFSFAAADIIKAAPVQRAYFIVPKTITVSYEISVIYLMEH